MGKRKDMGLLKNIYPDKFEVYLISTVDDKHLYAGQGRCGIRAQSHLNSSGAQKFGYLSSEIKLSYRVIVASKKEAIDLEERFIEKFNPEFNICQRSTGIKGYHHSEETKRKISETQIGKPKNFSDEVRMNASIRIRNRNLGSHHSEEVKKKMSESRKGKKASDETRLKMSLSAKIRCAQRAQIKGVI